MERYRLTSTFNGGLSQRPTFQTNASSYISLPSKPHLSEPPFSSYVRPKPTTAEDNIGPQVDDNEISIFDAERYFSDGHDQPHSSKKGTVVLDGINERCELSTNPRESSVSSVDGYGRNSRNGFVHSNPRESSVSSTEGYERNCRNGFFLATPTASSEASWNSQSGLLSNPPGSVAVSVRAFPLNEQRKGPSSPGRWLFRPNCPCFGQKSVDVEEKYSEPKSPIHSNCGSSVSLSTTNKQSSKAGEVRVNVVLDGAAPKEREKGVGVEEMANLKISVGNSAKDQDFFTGSTKFSPEKHFPAEIGSRVVKSGRPFNEGIGFSFPVLHPPVNSPEDPARDSLEVFRPPEEAPATRKSTELQRRMWRAAVAEDDVASDTSSDLFELESFSSHRRRDSLDEMSKSLDPRKLALNAAGILQFRRSLDEAVTPSIAPSECYAPSEVSVEWSVTTAEGFDRASVANFSSAASGYEEFRFIQSEHDRFAAAFAGGGGGGKRRGNGLLSCRCEKAVSVGPSPVKCGGEQRRVGSGVFVAEPDRVQGMGRLGNGSAAVHDRPTLARSRSARMCRALATR